ncbi:MAG: hypothetical protein IJ106_02360 [Parasporobacterium sp.]|nr:hypothetical protein [Parasporobacterium sp.]
MVFVSAPFTYPPIPSIALSIFQASLDKLGISSKILYPMYPFLHMLGQESIRNLSWVPRFQGMCEFLFSHLTDLKNPFTPQDYVMDIFRGSTSEEQQEYIRLLDAGRRQANRLTDAVAQRAVHMGARILALSSVYTQQNASLAICRRVKELDPGIITILGGGNVSGRWD